MRIILRNFRQSMTNSSVKTCLRVLHNWVIISTLRRKVQKVKRASNWWSIHGCLITLKTSIWTTFKSILLMITMMIRKRRHGQRRKLPKHHSCSRALPSPCKHGSDKLYLWSRMTAASELEISMCRSSSKIVRKYCSSKFTFQLLLRQI